VIHRLFRPKHDARTETIWLTIYADLMTNLMLVFLSLYGLTIMGSDSLSRAVQSMKLGEVAAAKNSKLDFDTLAPALREKFRNVSNVKVTEDIGAVRIEFGEQALFDSGRALPKPRAKEIMTVVANMLKTMPHTIIVEGHTDSLPLQRGGPYRDNYELSLARAMSVVRILIETGVPQDQLAAAAYGAYQPRASNSDALGRSINRRVEIALFKDIPYEHR